MTTPSKPEASLRELPAKWRSEGPSRTSGGCVGARRDERELLANELEAALSARDEAVYEGSGCVFCDLNTEHKGNPCTATPPASGEAGAVGEDAKWKRLDFERYGGMADFDVGGVTLRLTYEEACVVDGILSRVIADFTALIRRLAAVAPAPSGAGLDDDSRFFIEHGVVHDRKTGRHLRGVVFEWENDSPENLLEVLRGLEREAWSWRMTAKTTSAAAVAPAGMDGWQPIETAPKDGTDILVCCVNAPTPGADLAHWNAGWVACSAEVLAEIGEERADEIGRYVYATHWMPLPAAPTPPATAGKE